MKKIMFLALGSISMLYFTSCDNQLQDNLESEELTVAELEVSALKSVESTEEEVDAAKYAYNFNAMTMPPKTFFGRYFPECADVTVDGDAFPKTITIDYGDQCLTRRGIVKTGKVIISLSDSLKTPGATYSVVYDNVTINGNSVEFMSTYTFEGENEDGNVVVSWTSSSTREKGDSIIIVREMAHSKEWLDGYGTREISDDKFLLNGGGTITINDTLEFSREIIDPLFYDRTCRFVLSGIIEIKRDGEEMLIDFGDGTCDNIAVVTKDGESEEIELITSKFKRKIDRTKRNMKRRNGWW